MQDFISRRTRIHSNLFLRKAFQICFSRERNMDNAEKRFNNGRARHSERETA